MTGAELARQCGERGWDCAAFTRDQLDITDFRAVEAAVGNSTPDVVVNAAAYTAVDEAEQHELEATLINALGARNVAHAAASAGALIVHISTDYVFDGASRRAYRPAELPTPVNAYGRSKYAGEVGVEGVAPRHLILRTSWVYSHEGRNFVRTMIRLGQERSSINVVNDQHGSPTSAHDLAQAILDAAGIMVRNPSLTGIYHFSNSGVTTWYDFANEIFQMRGASAPVINPISSAEYPTPAERPEWSVLDCTSFEKEFGIRRRPWQAALADVLGQIA
jgi:dTDP-4-dehydrorhamnose reductase